MEVKLHFDIERDVSFVIKLTAEVISVSKLSAVRTLSSVNPWSFGAVVNTVPDISRVVKLESAVKISPLTVSPPIPSSLRFVKPAMTKMSDACVFEIFKKKKVQ